MNCACTHLEKVLSYGYRAYLNALTCYHLRERPNLPEDFVRDEGRRGIRLQMIQGLLQREHASDGRRPHV